MLKLPFSLCTPKDPRCTLTNEERGVGGSTPSYNSPFLWPAITTNLMHRAVPPKVLKERRPRRPSRCVRYGYHLVTDLKANQSNRKVEATIITTPLTPSRASRRPRPSPSPTTSKQTTLTLASPPSTTRLAAGPRNWHLDVTCTSSTSSSSAELRSATSRAQRSTASAMTFSPAVRVEARKRANYDAIARQRGRPCTRSRWRNEERG